MNTSKPKDKTYICIPEGDFHIWDAVTVAIISLAFENNIFVFHSNDKQLYKISDILVNAKDKRFKSKRLTGTFSRDNFVAYACAGWAWEKYGRDILKDLGYSESILEKSFKVIDEKVIQPVDKVFYRMKAKTDFDYVNTYLLSPYLHSSEFFSIYNSEAFTSAVKRVKTDLITIIRKEKVN